MSSVFTADLKGIVAACPSCGQKSRVPYERLAAQGTCGKCEASLPLVSAPVDIPSTAVFDALIAASALPVLVDFWAARYGIQGIPALLLFKSGKLVAEQAGAQPASAIRDFIHR